MKEFELKYLEKQKFCFDLQIKYFLSDVLIY